MIISKKMSDNLKEENDLRLLFGSILSELFTALDCL